MIGDLTDYVPGHDVLALCGLAVALCIVALVASGVPAPVFVRRCAASWTRCFNRHELLLYTGVSLLALAVGLVLAWGQP